MFFFFYFYLFQHDNEINQIFELLPCLQTTATNKIYKLENDNKILISHENENVNESMIINVLEKEISTATAPLLASEQENEKNAPNRIQKLTQKLFSMLQEKNKKNENIQKKTI